MAKGLIEVVLGDCARETKTIEAIGDRCGLEEQGVLIPYPFLEVESFPGHPNEKWPGRI